MRTNSIIGDSVAVPSFEPPKPPEVTQTDWEKIANSSKYKQVNDYLETRKEFYRRYFPDGRPVAALTAEERVQYWNTASIVIGEIEAIQANLLLSKKK